MAESLAHLERRFWSGDLSRRDFVRRSLLLGAATTLVGEILAETAAIPVEAKGLTIGFNVLDVQTLFFTQVRLGAARAAKVAGVNVIYNDSKDDPAVERSAIQDFISRKVDGICMDGIAATTASVKTLELAVAAGIPVVADDAVNISPKKTAEVTTDQLKLGRQTGVYAAQFIQKHLGGKAVVMAYGFKAFATARLRRAGFLDGLNSIGSNKIKVLDEQDASYLRESAFSTTQNVLTAHPEISILWGWNEGSMLGALAALKAAKKKGTFLFGTDMSDEPAREMLNPNSYLVAVTSQTPDLMGQLAVETVLKAINKQPIKFDDPASKTIYVPVQLFTRDDPAGLRNYIKTHPNY